MHGPVRHRRQIGLIGIINLLDAHTSKITVEIKTGVYREFRHFKHTIFDYPVAFPSCPSFRIECLQHLAERRVLRREQQSHRICAVAVIHADKFIFLRFEIGHIFLFTHSGNIRDCSVGIGEFLVYSVLSFKRILPFTFEIQGVKHNKCCIVRVRFFDYGRNHAFGF